jgi:hypothetical protein
VRTVAVRSFETVRDTEEQPPELDERTIKELMDLGASAMAQPLAALAAALPFLSATSSGKVMTWPSVSVLHEFRRPL